MDLESSFFFVSSDTYNIIEEEFHLFPEKGLINENASSDGQTPRLEKPC